MQISVLPIALLMLASYGTNLPGLANVPSSQIYSSDNFPAIGSISNWKKSQKNPSQSTKSLNEQHQAYRNRIKIHPSDWVFWAEKGTIEYELNKRLLAEKSFQQAILLARTTFPNQMSNASFNTKNNSKMAYCLLCLGKCAIIRKDFNLAEKYLKESFRFNKFDSQTTTSLWFSLISQGKCEEASPWLEISHGLQCRQSDFFNTTHYIPSTSDNQ